jgi:hyperosmotically inducible protein
MRTLLVVLLCAIPLYAASDQATRPSSTTSADEWVTTQIQARYFLDRDIKARTIDVSTLNGAVTLTGDVQTPDERTRAAEIASRVSGVKRVINNLRVEAQPQTEGTSGTQTAPPTPPTGRVPGQDEIERVTHSDPVILTEIKTRYAVDPDISALDVHVSVESGVVTLTGDVADTTIRQRAENLARAVPGVKEVKNQLKVKR